MSENLDLLKDQFEKRRGGYYKGDSEETIIMIGIYERRILEQIANEIRVKMMDDFIQEFNQAFTDYKLSYDDEYHHEYDVDDIDDE